MNSIKQYSKTVQQVTSTSSSLALLPCYLLPDRFHDRPSFTYICEQLFMVQKSEELAQPPILTHLVQ